MEAKEAVKQLTQLHHAMIGSSNVEREPLIDLLHQARYSSSGVPGVGSTTRGLPIDAGAIALYEDYDDRIRSRLEQYGQPSFGDLKACTTRLHNALTAINIDEGLDPREFDIFGDTVRRIEDFFDPPKEHELLGECPECEATHVINSDGEQAHAVKSVLRPGYALQAECVACGKMWVGKDDLLWLARHMQANSDWDTLEVLGITSM